MLICLLQLTIATFNDIDVKKQIELYNNKNLFEISNTKNKIFTTIVHINFFKSLPILYEMTVAAMTGPLIPSVMARTV